MSPSKMVPEGIEGRVPYRGPVGDVLFQMVGGLRSGMGYCGAADIASLQRDVEMVQITTRRPARVAPARRDDHPRSAELQRLNRGGARRAPRRSTLNLEHS